MSADPSGIPADPAAFREFVRRHHPDRGGDPDVFAAGVSAYRARGRDAPPQPVVFAAPGPVRRQVRRGLRAAGTLPALVRRRVRRGPPRVR